MVTLVFLLTGEADPRTQVHLEEDVCTLDHVGDGVLLAAVDERDEIFAHD